MKVDNRAGHKFPSGVAFRRAFIEFNVLGADNQVLWASGRTNGVGVIVDDKRNPIAGELWWRHDCSARIDPLARIHQPHYQVITPRIRRKSTRSCSRPRPMWQRPNAASTPSQRGG